MTQTLKNTAFTNRCLHIIAVDEDGTTLKDFVADHGVSVSPSVSFGTSTWAGISRPFFETKPNGTFDFFGIEGISGAPNVPFATSAGWFMVVSDFRSTTNYVFGRTNLAGSMSLNGSKFPTIIQYTASGVSINTSATKFSFGGDYRDGGVCQSYYGTDGTSTTPRAAATVAGGFGTNTPISAVGGVPGQGNYSAKFHLFVITSGALTTAEADNLHNDWYTYLFTSGGVSASGGGDAAGFRPWYTRSSFIVGR